MSITNFHKGTLLFLPFFLLSLPFLVIPGMYNPYEFPKFIVLLSGIQLFIMVRSTYCLVAKKPLIHRNRVSLLVIVFFVLVLCANIFGLDPTISFVGSMYRHQGFLLWSSLGLFFLLLYAQTTAEKKQLRETFSFYTIISLLLLCMLTITDSIRLFFFHDYRVAVLQGRFAATLGNPNFLAGYTVMLLPLALFGTTRLKRSHFFKKSIHVLLVSSCMVLLLLADSKSALLAFTIVTSLWVYQYIYPSHKKFTVLSMIFVVLIILTVFFSPNRFSAWDNRSIIWSQGIQSVMRHPLLGIGQENYELVANAPFDNAHNMFLEIAVAAGIPALLVFMYILFLLFSKSSYPIRLSLVAFGITSFFNPVSIIQLATLWFLLSLASYEG